jgi:hypothetical protein
MSSLLRISSDNVTWFEPLRKKNLPLRFPLTASGNFHAERALRGILAMPERVGLWKSGEFWLN